MVHPLKSGLTVLATLLVLAGCSTGEEDSSAVGDDMAASPDVSVTTAPPTSTTSPASPTSPTSPTSPASPATAAGNLGVVSLREACQSVVADERAALDTVASYIEAPLQGEVGVRELDQIRSELLVSELSAPEPLRQELNRQVGVLNSLVQGIQDGRVGNVDLEAFRASGEQILQICADATR